MSNLIPSKIIVSKIIVKERRRYDRETMQEQERRRFERVELSVDAHVEDECGRRLGVVTGVGGGGLRVFFENDEQMRFFVSGKQMTLTVVEESGTRTDVHVQVAYLTASDAGLEFV